LRNRLVLPTLCLLFLLTFGLNGCSPISQEIVLGARADVEVLESGRLAISSGPVFDPSGQKVGRFNSIWRKDEDDTWRVVFDKGS
jgi:hypothetical protein